MLGTSRPHPHALLPRSLVALALALVATVAAHGQPDSNPCSIGWAQAPRIDPRNFYVNCFPELGRMIGTITHPHFPGDGEEYGATVYALGDVDRDSIADWIVTHRRADTSVKGVPVELLLYHGRRGGLPPVESGQRIGPSELGADVSFIATGDWDADSYKDLAISIVLHGDTSENDPGENYRKISVVIFWGSPLGYSINDTTRLSNGAHVWTDARGISTDLDGDGVEDLYLRTIYGLGLSDGKLITIPKVLAFCGKKGARWGRDDRSRLADWSWWNPPSARTIARLDQDGDGNQDLIYYGNPDAGSAETAQLVTIYGKPGGGFPDTNAFNIQTIRFDRPDSTMLPGSFSILSDVSGDSLPELLVFDNDLRTLRIYIGLRRQRLLQQYGNGNEPAHPDSTVWWGKPWARIDMPNKINPDSWAHPYNILYDLGDANFDGVNDIWALSEPFLVCYSSGYALDSLIDGMADTRPGGTYASGSGIVRLGDIDGNGIPAFAVNFEADEHSYPEAFPGGVKFFKMTDSVPWWNGFGEGRRYPPYTLRSTVADVTTERGASRATMLTPLVMEARPNPTTGEVRLSWTIPAVAGASLAITDERGVEVERIELRSGVTSASWNGTSKPRGVYLASLHLDSRTTTVKILAGGL